MMTGLQRSIWQFLTPRGRPILAALLLSFCAGDPDFLRHVRMERVVKKTERYISELPFFFFFGFKVTLYLIEYAVPPLAWKFKRFSRMTLEQQLHYLDTWEHSLFPFKRIIFKLVKAVCVCQILSEHGILAEMGYGDDIRARIGKRAEA